MKYLKFLTAGILLTIMNFKADIPNPDRNEIKLEWSVQGESNVMHYELRRKMIRDTEFQTIAQVDAKPQNGSANNYQYTDRNVFRGSTSTEPVVYELSVVFTNGEIRFVGQAEVNYTSTAIRRTWGSIKAMFQ
jgi:hypothetical protein